ncbi:hypothetical protein HWV62_32369 [Athelia sp. TMB]|nr:hypothetical protein HWV62_32369 [Athelia sp. TMB]
MSSGQPSDLSRQMQIYMQPNLVLTPEQVATAKTQAELLEKAAALVRLKAEEGARRYQLEQLRKQVEEGERARLSRTPSGDNAASYMSPTADVTLEGGARIEEIPANSSTAEFFQRPQGSSNFYNSNGQPQPQPPQYRQQPPAQRNSATYGTGSQHSTSAQMAQISNPQAREQAAQYQNNAAVNSRMQNARSSAAAQAQGQNPSQGQARNAQHVHHNSQAQNAFQPQNIAQAQNVAQAQYQSTNPRDPQPSQTHFITQPQIQGQFRSWNQYQPQVSIAPPPQSRQYYRQQNAQPSQQPPSVNAGQSPLEYHMQEAIAIQGSASGQYYRINLPSAPAIAPNTAVPSAVSGTTQNGKYSSSLQGALGQQNARANAAGSRAPTSQAQSNLNTPDVSLDGIRMQQQRTNDGTQSNGQSTALTLRRPPEVYLNTALGPIAPQAGYSQFSASDTSPVDAANISNAQRPYSSSSNNGISRDTAITIPVDVESRPLADSNRTLSNIRHINIQPAAAGSSTRDSSGPYTGVPMAQAPSADTTTSANVQKDQDAFRPIMNTKISDASPFYQPSVPNQDNTKSPNMPTTPTHQGLASGPLPRTPASVDKRHLARDLLRNLRAPLKRKPSQELQQPEVSGKRAREDLPTESAPALVPTVAPATVAHVPVAPVLVTPVPVTPITVIPVPIATAPVPPTPVPPTTLAPIASVMAEQSRQGPGQEEEEEAEAQLIETMVASSIGSPADVHLALSSQNENAIGAADSTASATATSEPQPVAGPSKTKEPLFLPSPASSREPSIQYMDLDIPDESHTHQESGNSEEFHEAPIPPDVNMSTRTILVPYVHMWDTPDWVTRYKQRRNARKKEKEIARQKQIRQPPREVLVVSDSEDEIEEWDGEGITQRGTKISADGTSDPTSRRPLNLMEIVSKKQKQTSGGKMVGDTHDLLAKPEELLKHCDEDHKNDQLRPEPVPFEPTEIALHAVPKNVPSWTVPGDVRQEPITQERHAVLGPWASSFILALCQVLRNIFGPVSLKTIRQNAAAPLRDTADDNIPTIVPDEYDFLVQTTPAPNIHMEDLASEAVTRLVDAGLTLWGPEEDLDTPMKVEDSPSKMLMV